MALISPIIPPLGVDPYTQAMRALRNLIVNDPQVSPLINPRLFPDLAGTDPNPVIDTVTEGQLPDLIISPASGRPKFSRTNIDHADSMTFLLRLRTGEVVTHTKLFPLRWALFCCFARMYRDGGNVPGGRLGLSFVERVSISDVSHSLATLGGREDASGVVGWVSLFSIEVEFRFSDKDCIAGTQGGG